MLVCIGTWSKSAFLDSYFEALRNRPTTHFLTSRHPVRRPTGPALLVNNRRCVPTLHRTASSVRLLPKSRQHWQHLLLIGNSPPAAALVHARHRRQHSIATAGPPKTFQIPFTACKPVAEQASTLVNSDPDITFPWTTRRQLPSFAPPFTHRTAVCVCPLIRLLIIAHPCVWHAAKRVCDWHSSPRSCCLSESLSHLPEARATTAHAIPPALCVARSDLPSLRRGVIEAAPATRDVSACASTPPAARRRSDILPTTTLSAAPSGQAIPPP